MGWVLKQRITWLVLLFAAAISRPAFADGYVNGGLGLSFGSPAANGRASFVGDIGFLSREPIGVEIDATYAPSFFRDSVNFTENRLATVMGNVIFAGRSRDRGRFGRRGQVRPYVSLGIGVMSEHVAEPGNTFSAEHLGVNAGVGIMALPRRSIGIRADIRYFQDLVGAGSSNIDFGSFHFWRAGIGVIGTF